MRLIATFHIFVALGSMIMFTFITPSFFDIDHSATTFAFTFVLYLTTLVSILAFPRLQRCFLVLSPAYHYAALVLFLLFIALPSINLIWVMSDIALSDRRYSVIYEFSELRDQAYFGSLGYLFSKYVVKDFFYIMLLLFFLQPKSQLRTCCLLAMFCCSALWSIAELSRTPLMMYGVIWLANMVREGGIRNFARPLILVACIFAVSVGFQMVRDPESGRSVWQLIGSIFLYHSYGPLVFMELISSPTLEDVFTRWMPFYNTFGSAFAPFYFFAGGFSDVPIFVMHEYVNVPILFVDDNSVGINAFMTLFFPMYLDFGFLMLPVLLVILLIPLGLFILENKRYSEAIGTIWFFIVYKSLLQGDISSIFFSIIYMFATLRLLMLLIKRFGRRREISIT